MNLLNIIKSTIIEGLNEARRNPEINVDSTVSAEISQFVDKYKNNEDLIFVSFRDSVHVTFINPNNKYGTPTGIYTYPWKNYYDKKFNELIKNKYSPRIGRSVPFAGDRHYMFLYKLKSNQGILTSESSYNDTLPYAENLLKFYENIEEISSIVKKYINNYDEYVNSIYNENKYAGRSMTEIHKFWILLYIIAGKTNYYSAQKIQNIVSSLCRSIGVNGFVDNGTSFIHPSEPYQAVFFKGRSLFEDLKIIDIYKNRNAKKPNQLTKDYIDNSEFDYYDIETILSSFERNPNNLSLVIDRLLSSDNFINKLNSDGVELLLNYSLIVSKEKVEQLINKLLSSDTFINKLNGDEAIVLLIYSLEISKEKLEQVINKLLSSDTFINNLNSYGVEYLLKYSLKISTEKLDQTINILLNKGLTKPYINYFLKRLGLEPIQENIKIKRLVRNIIIETLNK